MKTRFWNNGRLRNAREAAFYDYGCEWEVSTAFSRNIRIEGFESVTHCIKSSGFRMKKPFRSIKI